MEVQLDAVGSADAVPDMWWAGEDFLVTDGASDSGIGWWGCPEPGVRAVLELPAC
jgi:hypothetical protein